MWISTIIQINIEHNYSKYHIKYPIKIAQNQQDYHNKKAQKSAKTTQYIKTIQLYSATYRDVSRETQK